MKKTKGKVELRYYDIPQNEFLIALQGDYWKRQYGTRDSLMHFHNLMEIGICHSGSGEMAMEQESWPYHESMISVIPPNYPHNTISEEDAESFWEYLFVDVEKILQSMYPDDILFQQKMLERINHKAYLGDEAEVPELAAMVRAILEETRRKRDSLYKESIRGLSLALLIQVARIHSDNTFLPEELRQKRGALIRFVPLWSISGIIMLLP